MPILSNNSQFKRRENFGCGSNQSCYPIAKTGSNTPIGQGSQVGSSTTSGACVNSTKKIFSVRLTDPSTVACTSTTGVDNLTCSGKTVYSANKCTGSTTNTNCPANAYYVRSSGTGTC